MIINDYVYSSCIVCLAEMDDGEVFVWDDPAVIEKSYNCYMLSGKLIMSRSSDPGFVPYECGVTGTFTRGDVLDDTQQAVGKTRWICISKLPNSPEKIVTLQHVDGVFELPTGTGFVVLEGSVTTSTNITANQCQYFRPRDSAVELTGIAALALIQ